MFGSDPFGSVPFGASGSTVFDYDAMLSESRTRLVYTVELDVWNIATDTLETLYLGSAEWATSPTDIPASTPFDGRLQTVLSFSRSIIGDRIGINFTSGDGTISWANSDGAYDTYVDGYAVDRREVIVRVGRKTDAFANHLAIFTGVAVDWAADQDTVTLTVRDKGDLLNVPAQPNVYAGTGGAEGGADLTGKRKPLLFGIATGVEPPLLDSALLIYQVNDGSTFTIGTLDRGVQLAFGVDYVDYAALAGASIGTGDYATCLAAGLFRLGAAPDGILLASCARSGAPFDGTAEAIRALLAHTSALPDEDVDVGSLDKIAVDRPELIMHYIGPSEAVSISDAVAKMMVTLGGWAGFNRAGQLTVGEFNAPAGDAVATFKRDEGDILDLRWEKLPSGIWPPPWRWRVACLPIETTFTDFAGAVDEAIKSYYAQPYRLVSAEDAGVLADHLGAQDPAPVEARYLFEADAQAEADRLLALYSAGYHLYRMTLTRRALTLDIGDAIHITFARFGLDGGKLLRVVAIDDRIEIGDGSEVDQVEITAYG